MPSGIGMGIWIGNSPGNTITHNEIYDIYGIDQTGKALRLSLEVDLDLAEIQRVETHLNGLSRPIGRCLVETVL